MGRRPTRRDRGAFTLRTLIGQSAASRATEGVLADDDNERQQRPEPPPNMVVSKNGALYVALAILGVIALSVMLGVLTSS